MTNPVNRERRVFAEGGFFSAKVGNLQGRQVKQVSARSLQFPRSEMIKIVLAVFLVAMLIFVPSFATASVPKQEIKAAQPLVLPPIELVANSIPEKCAFYESIPCFKVKDKIYPFIVRLFAFSMDHLQKRYESWVIDAFEHHPNGFSIELETVLKLFQEYPKDLIKGYANPSPYLKDKVFEEDLKTLIKDAGVGIEEAVAIWEREVQAYFIPAFSECATKFTRELQSHFAKDCRKKINEYFLFEFLKRFGVAIAKKKLELLPKDLEFLELTAAPGPKEYRSINALEYVFCIKHRNRLPCSRLKKGFAQIFVDNPRSLNLRDFGYMPVEFPEKNDLVVYFSKKQNGHFKVEHVGIYLGDGRVESKRDAADEVFNHSLTRPIPCVRDHIAFFRLT